MNELIITINILINRINFFKKKKYIYIYSVVQQVEYKF